MGNTSSSQESALGPIPEMCKKYMPKNSQPASEIVKDTRQTSELSTVKTNSGPTLTPPANSVKVVPPGGMSGGRFRRRKTKGVHWRRRKTIKHKRSVRR